MSLRETWTGLFGPERYLKMWPMGPKADLARDIIGEETGNIPYIAGKDKIPADAVPSIKTVPAKIRFFSPRSNALSVIVSPIEWITQETPGGSRTIQSPGKTAQFENNVYVTDDPQIIDYLTTTYKDKRYPIVRDDVKTASAHN